MYHFLQLLDLPRKVYILFKKLSIYIHPIDPTLMSRWRLHGPQWDQGWGTRDLIDVGGHLLNDIHVLYCCTYMYISWHLQTCISYVRFSRHRHILHSVSIYIYIQFVCLDRGGKGLQVSWVSGVSGASVTVFRPGFSVGWPFTKAAAESDAGRLTVPWQGWRFRILRIHGNTHPTGLLEGQFCPLKVGVFPEEIWELDRGLLTWAFCTTT